MNNSFEALFQSYDIILNTVKGDFLSNSIDITDKKYDKIFPLATEISYGVFRRWNYLNFFITRLAKGKVPLNIKIILMIGLYQIEFLDNISNELAVFSTVELAKRLKMSRQSGLVNGILRNFLRKRESLVKVINKMEKNKRLSTIYSFPLWLVEKWENTVPYELEFFLNYMNKKNSVYLKKIGDSIKKYDFLKESDVVKNSFKLIGDIKNVTPLINNYQYIIQDIGSQIVSSIIKFDNSKKTKILDCCSSPGWKALSVLQNYNVDVKMIDKDTTKLQTFRKITKHVGLKGKFKIYKGFIQDNTELFKDDYFDYIIADVPCSNTGVLRRHPEKKMFLNQNALSQLMEEQRNILSSLYTLMKKNTILIYITCSLIDDENRKQLNWFKDNFDGLEFLSSLYLWPPVFDSDGFYLGMIKKII